MSRALVLVTTVLFDALVSGCGAADRPPPAGDPDDEVEVDPHALVRAPSDGGTVCEPGARRDCRVYYRDDNGQMQCPLQSQFCRADGRSWLDCGDRDVGPNPPQP